MVKPPKTALLSTQDELIPYPPEQSPFYITRKDQERPIRLAKTGIASRPPRTIPQLLEESAKKNKNKLMFAIEWPEPALDMSKKDQGPQAMIPPALPLSLWKSWTYSQGFEEIKMAAKGFIALGFKPLDTVSILGFNSPFWGFGAFAAIYAGGINNGMYGTDTDEQIVYKVQNSGTTIVLVDNETNYTKFYQNINEMPSLKAIVVWKDEKIVTSTNMTVQRKDGTTISVLTWEQLLKKGEHVTEETLQERVDNQRPGKCCTLVFTSGTTGMPKAVMISHDNVYFQTLAAEFTLGDFYKSNPLILISYLPLSHIAGFTLDIASTLSSFSSFHTEVYFARSYDLKYGSLRDRLVAVRPNFFFGVPRVWEKFQEAIAAKAPKKGFKKNLAAYAKKKAFKVQVNQQIGGSGSVPFGAGISGKILGKVHKALGLDRLNYALSGAAPIKQETLKYWGSLGIYIGEVYGMSENAGCCTTTTNKHRCWGSVGGPEFATEVKVFIVNPNDNNDKKECPPAESLTSFTEENQGELCYRGRHIMLGYLANPEMGKEHIEDIIKKNEAAIDKEGWLHSGDKGLVTKAGFFKITGRYKELIIGAGGENIAPVPIEDDFKARCGGVVSNVMMIGNERKYNVAVITLLCEGATGELPGTNILAGAAKTVSSAKTIEEACSDEKFVGFLLEKLNETNSNGKVITNQTFKIQKVCVLPKDFSVEQGELTPTLKLKRNVVEKKYEKMIDRIYETEGVFIKYQQE